MIRGVCYFRCITLWPNLLFSNITISHLQSMKWRKRIGRKVEAVEHLQNGTIQNCACNVVSCLPFPSKSMLNLNLCPEASASKSWTLSLVNAVAFIKNNRRLGRSYDLWILTSSIINLWSMFSNSLVKFSYKIHNILRNVDKSIN